MKTKLDPAEYKVSATDMKGHSTRFWFRGMPALKSQINRMIQSGTSPFRTEGAFLRWAVHKGMEEMQEKLGGSKGYDGVNAMIELLREEEFHADFALVFDKLRNRVMEHQRQGEDGEAQKLVLRMRRHILDMDKGKWRDKYLKELDNKYKGLLKGADTASLGRIEEE